MSFLQTSLAVKSTNWQTCNVELSGSPRRKATLMELLELVIVGAEAHVSLMAALALKLATAEHTITKRNISGLPHRSNCGMIAVTLSGRTYRRRSRLVLYDHPW